MASLDLSAAFDTVDYAIFLRRLQNLYGVEQTALQWFGSYLTDRTHQVCINNTLAESQFPKCGVPQGSVLGARLYSMYAYPMSTIIVKHNFQYHSYEDDTQIYLQCDKTDDAMKETINRLEKCIADVSTWMKKNLLKINEDKTEFIIFHRNQELIRGYSLQVGDKCILLSNSTKNFRCFFQAENDFKPAHNKYL